MLAPVELRPPSMPDEQPPRPDAAWSAPDAPWTVPPTAAGGPDPAAGAPPTAAGAPPTAAGGPVSWRVDRRVLIAKTVGAVVFAGAAVATYPNVDQMLVATLAAAGLAVLALRDRLAPVRVAADEGGVTVVAGFAGRRRLAWSDLERVRVDERKRVSLRSEVLELDAGDNLYFFSATELSAPCFEVAERLAALKARYAP